ncbi:probable WRKY transcription factor 65 [Phragmites australis]|uniref:probable WRKY transcription factor 65 n=1 Tax=Phragmites australis TaxID=29695 RepID=UPI002D7748C6|nr:probable WRKY transcription factor 65 [Phragmites australis]
MDGEWGDGAAVSSPMSGGEGKVGAAGGVSGDCAGSPVSPAVAPSTSPASRGRRRSEHKRVVTVPLADMSGPRPKGVGEGNMPTDEWAWRKYGQKPIKGSPFPRAYYRCSSSKGCPARKQVERSRAEPDKVIVTYSFEHNHSSVGTRAQNLQARTPKAQPVPPDPVECVSAGSHNVAVTCAGAAIVEVHDDFRWLYDGVSITSSASPSDVKVTDEMLFGSMFFGATLGAPAPLPDEFGDVGVLFSGEGSEEDAMFAGLGELPECAMVFRRHAGDGLAMAGGMKVEQPAEGTAMS